MGTPLDIQRFPPAGARERRKHPMVNKDQVKGAARQASGAVKEAAGKLTGSKKTEVKGAGEKAAGKVQKTYGDVKEKVRKSI
jgi:uncharacterized protein YjbJ (UPF0337 family)